MLNYAQHCGCKDYHTCTGEQALGSDPSVCVVPLPRRQTMVLSSTQGAIPGWLSILHATQSAQCIPPPRLGHSPLAVLETSVNTPALNRNPIWGSLVFLRIMHMWWRVTFYWTGWETLWVIFSLNSWIKIVEICFLYSYISIYVIYSVLLLGS